MSAYVLARISRFSQNAHSKMVVGAVVYGPAGSCQKQNAGDRVVRGTNETLSIYVVNNDNAMRDSLAELLEPEGFIVRQYASVDNFLADVKEDHPGEGGRACLLLDLHMPGEGGQELLDILIRRNIRLPVVVMTGNTDEKTKSLALQKGAFAFLEMPVDADRLIDTLRDAIG